MDRRLVAWGQQVKARRRGSLPPLWLFTDPQRTEQVERAVAGLPRGLSGVVFRHEDAALQRRVARICRERRLVLVVAGRTHLRRGRGPRVRDAIVTASAHDAAELIRARRAGAKLVFLSPVFPTVSHPGAGSLGPIRFAALACRARVPCCALGGVSGTNARRLPRFAAGCGAIGALLP